MKKKVALTAAAVAMVGTLAVGGTLAWFTDTETATNVVTMGEVDITLEEDGGSDGIVKDSGLTYDDVMPGDTFQKTVKIENHENDAYVRATITVKASEVILNTFNTENALTFTNLDMQEKSWNIDNQAGTATLTVTYADDDHEMEKDDVWTLFEKIVVPTSWGNEFVNETFTITVNADAIQAANLTEAQAWTEFERVVTPDLKDTASKAQYDKASPAQASRK